MTPSELTESLRFVLSTLIEVSESRIFYSESMDIDGYTTNNVNSSIGILSQVIRNLSEDKND